MTSNFSVWFVRRDGRGSQLWKDSLSRSEAIAQRRFCLGAVTDATMVWAVEPGNSNAVGDVLIREDEEPRP